MPAQVDERLYPTVLLAHDDDVVTRHLYGDVVERPGNLRAVGDDRWNTPEDVVALLLGQYRISEFVRLEGDDVGELVGCLIAQQLQGSANAVLTWKRCRHVC